LGSVVKVAPATEHEIVVIATLGPESVALVIYGAVSGSGIQHSQRLRSIAFVLADNGERGTRRLVTVPEEKML